ncbi:phosphoglycerate dehydrogenase [Candidatus Roizmanbacteria bacterium]|nr:phosphoglycerate dehydrogenase [Candidatus Roizmanbacteria bacterium]
MKRTFYLIDFDSTFITRESLEELALVSLKTDKNKDRILHQIAEITSDGMEGKIPFHVSLSKRLRLIRADKKDIKETVARLRNYVTPSIRRNKQFFKQNAGSIYIISGGFKETIQPVVREYGLRANHVFANEFVYDKNRIVGVDRRSPLAYAGGKQKVFKSLNLKGTVCILGDGYTDYEIRRNNNDTTFIAFTENVTREKVLKVADKIVGGFDEFLYLNRLPTSISRPKSKVKVLLLEGIHDAARGVFQKEGYSIESLPKAVSEDELCHKIADVSLLGIRSRTRLSRRIIDSGHRLLGIGAFCIGTEQIDLKAAKEKGVAVFNAPFSNTRSVVELIIGEIIMLARQVFEKSTKAHSGIWEKSAVGAHEIRGETLGIVGYGNIGSQLSVVAEAIGLRVCFFDIKEKLALGNAVCCQTLDELLKKSDFVTIHVDGRSENKNLIGKSEFAKMKKGAIFLNASRGFVVDEEALAESLKSGKIGGAAVDVFRREPAGKDELFVNPFQRLPNVILTPHIGGSTEEAQQNIGEFVAKKLVTFINTGSSELSVNLPPIQLPKLKDAHRLLHIYYHKQGLLAKINTILAAHNVKVFSQYLKADETMGYVITDVDKNYHSEALTTLKLIPETIRFRVLC